VSDPAVPRPAPPFSHRVEHGLVRAAEAVACALPAGVARGLGRGLGRLSLALGVRRGVARANIARAFPDRPRAWRESLLREAYAQIGATALENLRMARTGSAELDRIAAHIDGIENVPVALAAGKGAILVTGHFGAFELMGAALARRVQPVSFLVRDQSNARVDSDLKARRRALGVSVLGHGNGVRDVFRALHDNTCVAIIADQDAGRRGVFVDFFGTPTSTPPGPAEFCVRADAPLVLGYLVRGKDGAYAGRILRPIPPPRSGDHDADVRTLTQAHARALEGWIREHPEQWLWTHRRWKTAPPAGGEAPRARAALVALVLACLAVGAAGPAHAAGATPQGAFDGAGSSLIPLSAARVKRVFEGVRVRRETTGWSVDAVEVFQAGVAPARAAMGLPDYRASVDSDSVAAPERGTVRDLEVTVDGLPMGVEALPGSAAASTNLGGISRVFRWEVPFAGEEIRTVRVRYRIGESLTDRGEPLLFFYLNPGALWPEDNARVTVSVDLGAVDPDDVIPGWVRPSGYRVYGHQIVWTGRGGEVTDIALSFRAEKDPRAASADSTRGPLALAPDALEEWFERLTIQDARAAESFLTARRNTPVERWPRAERLLWERLDGRLADWQRAHVPAGTAVVDSPARSP
jgi:KDO2-lipid IV(A) lauroyltransferase